MSTQKDLLTGAENAPQTADPVTALQTPAQTANVAPWRAAIRRAQEGFTRLSSSLEFDREAAYAIEVMNKNSFLQKMDEKSIQDSIINVAKLGLTLNTKLGLCYLVPRKGECCLDIGYKGMIYLLVQAGAIKFGTAETICENDEWENTPTEAVPLKHRIKTFDPKERGKIIGAYAKYLLPDGTVFIPFVVPRSRIDEIMERSESVKTARKNNNSYSPWFTDFEAMAKKTAVRATFSYVPVTTSDEIWRQRISEAVSIADADFTDVSEKPKRPPLDVVEVIAD